MILRFLVLFGGIVMMITGCNGLVSQNFGTHRLRTLDVMEANAQSIGEADFVEVAGLGEKPMAWYWNLLLFVGGICLAFIPEAVRHNRKAANKT